MGTIPTKYPTAVPTANPSQIPSEYPSVVPTESPLTLPPSESPTLRPSVDPSQSPSVPPTGQCNMENAIFAEWSQSYLSIYIFVPDKHNKKKKKIDQIHMDEALKS